jgi:hypothetical protein
VKHLVKIVEQVVLLLLVVLSAALVVLVKKLTPLIRPVSIV